MIPSSMTQKEVEEFADHLQQLVMHAGHSLGDAKRGAPRAFAGHIEEMMAATRAYYRAAQRFEAQVKALAEREAAHDEGDP